jgi:hypothetical protein
MKFMRSKLAFSAQFTRRRTNIVIATTRTMSPHRRCFYVMGAEPSFLLLEDLFVIVDIK